MSKEEFIKNIVDNMTIRKVEGCNSTFYDYNWNTVFEHDPENDTLWVSCNYIWHVLKSEYSMQYADVQEFIKVTVVEALNLCDVIPLRAVHSIISPLWKP